MLRANEAARCNQNEAANECGKVRCEISGNGSTQGVADDMEGSPWYRRGLKTEEDLVGIKSGVVAIDRRVRSTRVAAAEEVKEHHSTSLLDKLMCQTCQRHAGGAYTVNEQNPITIFRAPFVDLYVSIRAVYVTGSW